MALMEADFCFLSLRHLEARGIFENRYAKLDDVPPQTWRSASTLWIKEPPLWSKLEDCLSMDSCSVKALRIGSAILRETQSMDWDGLWKILADPVCRLTCLCLETNQMKTLDVVKLFAQLQLTSRLQHLRLESCTMSKVDCEVIGEALSNPACPLLGLSLRVDSIRDARPLCLLQHRERKLVCLGLCCRSRSFEVKVWLCDLLRCLIDLRLEAGDGTLYAERLLHSRLDGPLDLAWKIAPMVWDVRLDRLSLYRPFVEFDVDRLPLVRAIESNVRLLPELCLKLKNLVLEGAFQFGELAAALEDPNCMWEALSVSPNCTPVKGEDALHSFSQALLHPHCRLKCFEFVGGFNKDDRVLTHIARALSSEDCKLESLLLFTSISSELGKRLVDALENNWTLCELNAKLPCDVQPRASNLLARNLRLRTLEGNVPSHDQLGACNLLTKNQSLTEGRPHHVQSGTSNFLSSNQSFTEGMLPQQCQMQPRSARLFLCGHERVGKTTIRNQLFYLAHKRVINPFHKVRKEVPTRGMEFQPLTFGKKEKKQLVICDLAGHKEYHAFHHFFVTGSDRDLFLVVCKITDRPLEQEFAFKLRYWLRFIASHRSPGKPCPKVMVVLNFFSSALSKDVMTSFAKSNTEKLLEDYADVLDFGKHGAMNVFGIDALKLHNFPPIIQRLEDLLTELLDSRSSIPRLCDEISSIIMPSRMTLIFGRPRDLCLPLSLIVRKYEKKFGNDSTQTNSGDRFLAALVELHNAGQIVFFPAHDEQKSMEQIVIIDCEWFCSNLIGILMQPEKLMGYERRNVPEQPGVWLREEVTHFLLQQNCKPEYVHHVLEYLQRLGLSYPVQDDEINGTLPPSKLIFPSLLLEPQPVQWLECNDKAAVFGRRLECQDKVKTLLPAGAFARLQVNLHSKFGNKSWRVGCGWISFMENGVATIVRFGGETSRWEDRQWIDIMVRYPEPLDQHENAVEEVVQFVKKQIFTICQGMDRGVPAVFLLESVMNVKALNSVSVDVVPLNTIKEELRKNGIGYQMTWSDYTSTPILDLFLSGELRELLALDFNALSEVAHEFDIADSDYTDSPPLWFGEQEDCGVVSDASLSEDTRLLFHLISHLIKREHGVLHDMLNKQGEILQDISEGVSQIRKNMGLLLKKLERDEGNILSSCSYQLVKDLITGPLPAFPFLTDEAGVWQQLKNLVGKEVKLHFMCEWYAGAHVIEGQKGLLVKISKPEWLVRAGPVLVPALKVMSCVAALAATVYLHGSRVFVPSFEWLDALGLNGGPGQRAFPAILKSFVDEVPELEELPSCQLPVDRSRLSHFLYELTEGKTVDMKTDFQLYRVEVPQKNRISWVCQDHSKGLKRLKNQSPFERTNTRFGYYRTIQ